VCLNGIIFVLTTGRRFTVLCINWIGFDQSVQSFIENHCKVGYWTSTVKKLRSRYGTSYGFDFDLWYYPTPEPRKLEMAFKTAFVAHHVSAELYEAYPLDAYRSFFRDATDAD
jgi:hypothetical protein